MSIPEHLEEISTAERIALVQSDNIRRWGQLIISFLLIGSAMGYLGWYTITTGDAEFKEMVAVGMFALVTGGVGAAFAIFGLGRTVGRRS